MHVFNLLLTKYLFYFQQHFLTWNTNACNIIVVVQLSESFIYSCCRLAILNKNNNNICYKKEYFQEIPANLRKISQIARYFPIFLFSYLPSTKRHKSHILIIFSTVICVPGIATKWNLGLQLREILIFL